MFGIVIVPLRGLQYAYCASVQHVCMHAFYISGNVQYRPETYWKRKVIAFWDALFYAMCFQLTNPASEDIAFTNVHFTLTAHFRAPDSII